MLQYARECVHTHTLCTVVTAPDGGNAREYVCAVLHQLTHRMLNDAEKISDTHSFMLIIALNDNLLTNNGSTRVSTVAGIIELMFIIFSHCEEMMHF